MRYSAPPLAPSAFIIGMSRSGTTWLVDCLNRHPLVAAFGETGFWGKHHVATPGGIYSADDSSAVLTRMPGLPRQVLEPRDIETVSKALRGDGLRKLFEPLRKFILEKNQTLSPRELFDHICGVVADYTEKRIILEKTPHHINYADRIVAAYPNARFIVISRNPYGFMRSYKHQGDRKGSMARETFKRASIIKPAKTECRARR